MKKIEEAIFYLFVFLVPFNVKKFLFNPLEAEPLTEFSALFLHLSDLLIIVLLSFWLIRVIKEKKGLHIKKIPLWGYFLLFFVLSLLLSLTQSQSLITSIYFLVKILLVIGLFFYLRSSLSKIKLYKSLKIIVFTGLIQSLIALGQYLDQSSLGLKYLGESLISPSLNGVAKIDLLGQKLIRAYGTFAHPNILACFLLLTLYIAIHLSLKKERGFIFSLPVLTLGLILTFSRAVLFTGAVSLVFFFVHKLFKEKNKSLILKTAFILCLSFSVFFLTFLPYLTERFNLNQEQQSVSLRLFYNQASYRIIKQSPLLGVGLGNFILKLKDFYPEIENWQIQPVHNIYLLIASEAGLISFVFFIAFLFAFLKKHFRPSIFSFLLFSFLFIGLFDHFFITINQGILMFWLALSLLSSKKLYL